MAIAFNLDKAKCLSFGKELIKYITKLGYYRLISIRSIIFDPCGSRKRMFNNPFRKKPWFLRVYGTSPLKTLSEKEKLLVMSNISFFHSVF